MLAIGGAKAQAVRLLDRYIADVGSASPDLKLPATILRRRISEHSREIYRPPLTLPFLGRDAEMSALQERFARARAGEAQCVVLVGEAGIGKTRLAEELCMQAVLAGACVERVATQPHDTHRPMATFADLVPKLLQLPGALGCSPESMAALRRLTTNDSDRCVRPRARKTARSSRPRFRGRSLISSIRLRAKLHSSCSSTTHSGQTSGLAKRSRRIDGRPPAAATVDRAHESRPIGCAVHGSAIGASRSESSLARSRTDRPRSCTSRALSDITAPTTPSCKSGSRRRQAAIRFF